MDSKYLIGDRCTLNKGHSCRRHSYSVKLGQMILSWSQALPLSKGKSLQVGENGSQRTVKLLSFGVWRIETMKFDFGDILKNGQGAVLHLQRLGSRGSSKICRNCMGNIIERSKIWGCTTDTGSARSAKSSQGIKDVHKEQSSRMADKLLSYITGVTREASLEGGGSLKRWTVKMS